MKYIGLGFYILFAAAPLTFAGEWSGNIAVEERLFFNSPTYEAQADNYASLSAQPEFHTRWDNDAQSFTFVPFVRADQRDDERSHFDIRELTWLKAADEWELRVGIRRLFWGVTESRHLVDIINQTDSVENIDGEDKLGQPMINLAVIQDWGTLDLFVLPGFRERTFPGEDSRLRSPLVVDTDQSQYQSADEDRHIDYAIRWTRTIDDWDIGLSHFTGTNRDPAFSAVMNSDNELVLAPYYNLIQQTGLDVQYIYDNWLWKIEAISRADDEERNSSMTGGFEYSFYGIAESAIDLGVIMEYHHDERENNIETLLGNDLMLGARFALNDVQSTEFLLGAIFDLDDDSKMYSLEGSRRLGDAWKLNIEARFFSGITTSENLLYSLRNDDMLQVELAWYF